MKALRQNVEVFSTIKFCLIPGNSHSLVCHDIDTSF